MSTLATPLTTQDEVAPYGVSLVAPAGSADPYGEMDLLRLSTAGSVDDGKSTLIGRLLYDTKSIFEDQLRAIEAASRRRGEERVNLALLTDGLRAEREQNITIDVAYRFFATPRRKFIIADTPGHLQYTRNMVTGASTADLAIVLLDARKGLLTQSKRHAYIASLLGIPHVVAAVNKMDLVDWREDAFRRIADELAEFASKLQMRPPVAIPISALHGDNVVARSKRMPWYEGKALLDHLESVDLGIDRDSRDFRFPIQYVIRPHQDYRGFAGRVVSGSIAAGCEVAVLPSGRTTRVRAVEDASGPIAEAAAGESVVITLEDDLDASRGDMLARPQRPPSVGRCLDTMICWMSDAPLDTSVPYVLMQTTRTTRAYLKPPTYRIDVDSLQRDRSMGMGPNDVGRIEITTEQPLCFDAYARNTGTGSFILIDQFTHQTVAAGMILSEAGDAKAQPPSGYRSSQFANGGAASRWNVPREAREARNGHRAAVLWLRGAPEGRTPAIARALELELFARGCQTAMLDGDQLGGRFRTGAEDRTKMIPRVREVAKLLYEHGHIVLCSVPSFSSREREPLERSPSTQEDAFLEVVVDHSELSLRIPAQDVAGVVQRIIEMLRSESILT